MAETNQRHSGEDKNGFTVPPLFKGINLHISSAVKPEDMKPSAVALREQFLEGYARHMDSIRDAGEGFVALKELLKPDMVGDELSLSDAGREGLAHIIEMLANESINAWASLPQANQLKEMLEEGGRA